MKDHKTTPNEDERLTADAEVDTDALVALLRLLLCKPPPNHDFKSCPICRKHGIREI
jgi:hypothetical protein